MKNKAGLTLLLSASLLVLSTVPAGAVQERADKPVLTFPVISDVHVDAAKKDSQRKFTEALEDLNRVNPNADALVINGDLTGGSARDYTRLKELMMSTPHPQKTFATIGNHEFYSAWLNAKGNWSPNSFPNKETEAASIGRFLSFTGEKKVYYEEEIKGYPFIFLGSEQYRQTNPDNMEDAYLSKEQLNWLEQSLARHGQESGKPIFVFLHQPLPGTVAGTSVASNKRPVVQHEELRSILSKYPQVIFFSGHTHWDLRQPNTLVRDKFTMVNSSSVERPWTSDGQGGEKLKDAKESEGLYVEVYEDRVSIQGRDFYAKKWIPEAQFKVPVRK
ncbi:metallophosphoesterase family protein [Paenibacillus chitinolyticus]|uniref:metallophosphoesterase family protein n=1 Tax=Paenibacillus chitinolyticus TaxID=79263 RepID=UPI0036704D85